jgi:hypothetical protein
VGISRAVRLRTGVWRHGFGSFCWGFGLGLFGLQATDFGQRAPDDAVGLGAGAVDGGLGAEQAGVEHRVASGLCREGGFDFGAAAETPRGTDYFGGEHFLKRALRAQVIPESAVEGFVFFGLVRLDAILRGEQADAESVSGGAVAAFRGAGAG